MKDLYKRFKKTDVLFKAMTISLTLIALIFGIYLSILSFEVFNNVLYSVFSTIVIFFMLIVMRISVLKMALDEYEKENRELNDL